MNGDFWDILNNGLSVIKSGADDYLDFIKTQRLNNILTDPNYQAGQIYTVGQAERQTGFAVPGIQLSYIIVGALFIIGLILVVSLK